MATQTASYVYTPACDKPDCLVEGVAVLMFLQNEVETTDNKRFLEGEVTSVVVDEELDTAMVELEYSDTTLPVDFVFSFPTEELPGTVCPPDCAGGCDWLPKVQALVDTEGDVVEAIQPTTFQYRVYRPSEAPAGTSLKLPRMPITPGATLASIAVTHDIYDPDTAYDLEITYGSNIVVQEHIVAAAGVQTTLLVTGVTLDEKPVVTITNFTSVSYLTPARGMVVTIQAVHL